MNPSPEAVFNLHWQLATMGGTDGRSAEATCLLSAADSLQTAMERMKDPNRRSLYTFTVEFWDVCVNYGTRRIIICPNEYNGIPVTDEMERLVSTFAYDTYGLMPVLPFEPGVFIFEAMEQTGDLDNA